MQLTANSTRIIEHTRANVRIARVIIYTRQFHKLVYVDDSSTKPHISNNRIQKTTSIQFNIRRSMHR